MLSILTMNIIAYTGALQNVNFVLGLKKIVYCDKLLKKQHIKNIRSVFLKLFFYQAPLH